MLTLTSLGTYTSVFSRPVSVPPNTPVTPKASLRLDLTSVIQTLGVPILAGGSWLSLQDRPFSRVHSYQENSYLSLLLRNFRGFA